ncbi:MAG: [FeFe] hydrogenase H-cluster radical SAM maturase HydG [Spirochaetes bacterium GWF1_41_5]|nr:MAG: [FeFe] hydrogenase H-cluster radical SAM maturase HydG [Spirochaetes bacterium GWF1_41_5]HBE03949.1 [FeFe] hydrogenase H-cluster radical SAM maturase HydG [Spirochaetia bacterium]
MFLDKLNTENINTPSSKEQFRIVLKKAAELKGLNESDAVVLMNNADQELNEELFALARQVKETIYGNRLVIFAPLYVSNLCANECSYCAFRVKNHTVKRRALSQKEISEEIKILTSQGHKRVLLVAGESYPDQGFRYILDSLDTIYRVKTDKSGEIRRINVNIAPLGIDEFKELKLAKIGTYQLFQETYHRQTYSAVHTAGKKADFHWRISALDRAFQAGISDAGIGVLFGLYNWKYEILALLAHIKYLENKFGIGPHTISVPRLEPAAGSDLSVSPPYPVSDHDFCRIVAILRLAVPYTGIIMSTRETARLRRETFAMGVSQISAGSRTNPGGYANSAEAGAEQFSLGDHRLLDEVIRDIVLLGYLPSFCTGCYRLGRVGADFMDLAKPGEIRTHCTPNGLSTFMEYLLDFASPETRLKGETLVAKTLSGLTGRSLERSMKLLQRVKNGERDVYC